MAVKLTKRQKEILALIESHMAATGSPPTRAEIAKTMGFRSPNAAEDHLRALARKGVIDLVPGTSRGIRLTSKKSGIPVITQSSRFSTPINIENIEETNMNIDRNLFSPTIDFLYRVPNSDFSQLGIHTSDLIAVHKTDTVETGQLALLRLNNEITIRRYSEALEAQDPIIEGLLVGIIRALPNSTFS